MWSDIFYPDNPKRREQLIRRNQELEDLMIGDFSATNQLIDVINKHMNCSFRHIFLNQSASLQENCDVIIGRIREIQAEVERVDRGLKEMLEPTLYEKLRNRSLSAPDFKAISKSVEAICGIATVGTTVLVGYLIEKGIILSNITSTFSRILVGTIASVALAVVFLGIDMIIEAVNGNTEREKLKEALEQYDRALEEFKPASEQYQDDITTVRMRIEALNG